jgi:crotonobetainyl-CoA:carnitine CoA-transferase CaiB-like acyl-CoA transferase
MAAQDTASRPLRVLEVASGAAASHAGRYLASLGASVARLVPAGVASPTLPELDVNKEVIHLDLGRPSGAAALAEALARADVVLRACDAAEVDAGPLSLAALRAQYAGLVTAAITPFGESGPHRGHAGTDLIALHAGGLGYGTPPRVVDPEKEYPLGIPGDPVGPMAGLVAVLGVLQALAERDRDGQGRHVEVSAQEAVVSLMFNNIAGVVEGGPDPSRLASARPGARRPFLPAADGLLVQMAGRPHHLTAWLELLGGPGKELLERLRSGAGLQEVAREAATASDAYTSGRTRRQVTDAAQAAHVPVEPVLTPAEVLECPQLRSRGFWETLPDGVRVAGHPFGPSQPGAGPRLLPAVLPRREGESDGSRGPLAGVKVVDFTWVFAGPIATRVLAALGADVLRVEGPDAPEGRQPAFLARTLHGGKRSARIDLRDAAGLETVRRLVAQADVLVENFSTGVLERYGLGWERLNADNPRLVMLSISGMGRTGPYAHHVLFGQLAQAYAGITAITGYEGGPPRGIEDGGFWSDPVTGYAGAAAVLAALREREVTGRGRRLDISLVEATAATLFRPLLAAARGDPWGTRGNFCPEMAPHDVYRCAPADEDRWVAIACRNDDDWQALCHVMGRADLLADASLRSLGGRQASRERLRREVEQWTRRLAPEEAAARLQDAGVPAAPSRTTAGLLADPHLIARGMFVGLAEGAPLAMRLPWLLHPPSAVSYAPAPAPGAHTREVAPAG